MTKDQYLVKQNAKEHVLVCISASPSNARIIKTAARMASAFNATFTALYVQTRSSEKAEVADKGRLDYHMKLAKELGADIATIYGDDVSYQIAEYARISGVTKIVIGRSNAKRHHVFGKQTLTEKLTSIAPHIDIHIIPDTASELQYRPKREMFGKQLVPSFTDILITLIILAVATGIGNLFLYLGFTETNIITIYILGVLLTSLFTKSQASSVICSLASVLLFNYFFTEPRLTFHAYEPGYPVTFVVMLSAALITGTLANKLKDHAKQSAQSAFRTKVLFDTNQLLQKAEDDDDIFQITASQLMKLLARDIIVYQEMDGKLSKGYLFSANPTAKETDYFAEKEKEVADWVFLNKHRAGALTNHYSDSKCLYLAIRINHKIFGVIGIQIDGKELDTFENSVLLSILGECALAINNSRNAKEKEAAAVLAKNEQLRANLLRAISHDLRTPLTTISGNASNLLSNYKEMDEAMRNGIFHDIFEDSQWLISLVENLLSITRLEEGRMNFNMSSQLIDEVIAEAVSHIKQKENRHPIAVDCEDGILMAKMDAKLIIQVILNLIDNAMKYTPSGTGIRITANKKQEHIYVSIIDCGPGIPDEIKTHVFEMFFTGNNKIGDSRRNLGLGLALCKSIIEAHGGKITLTDNLPHGAKFTFSLPASEVNMNE